MSLDRSYDVIVLGGGSAGIGAAIGAARSGAQTLLVERYGFLGGMATAGMVGTICGLFRSGTSSPKLVTEGFGAEFARSLTSDKDMTPVAMGRTFVMPYTPLAFATLADELTARERSLDVHLHTHLAAITSSGRQFESAHLVGPDGAFEASATSFVDSTGDAIAAVLAGAETDSTPLPERQLPAIVFHWQNVDASIAERGARVALLREVTRAANSGELPVDCTNLALRVSDRPGEVVMKIALTGLAASIAAEESQPPATTSERDGRRRVVLLAEHLRQRVPAFANAFVSHVAAQLGVRESRRIVGRYELTREDVLTGRKLDGGIVDAAWPIEIWHDGQLGPALEYVPDGDTYTIPLSSFQFHAVDNAYAVGRCMSGTREGLASARVIGTCLEAGYAIGVHAAESSRA